jgi:short-subunit dehydrogenase
MTNRFRALNGRFPCRRAFITGASSGLGLELARALGADGWTLGLFDCNVQRLAQVEAGLAGAGVAVRAYHGDVAQAEEVARAVDSFAAAHEGLDLMVNNAGVAAAGSLMDVTLEDWRWIIDINFMGVVHGARAAIPHLLSSGSGLIINVASAAAFVSAPGMISYNATKAAVLSLSETLNGELRDSAIQVAVVMPTFFQTGLLESFRGSPGDRDRAAERMRSSSYQVERVAHDVLLAAGAGRTYIVLPASARLLWRLKRWMPLLFLKWLFELRQRARPGGKPVKARPPPA